MNKFLIDVSLDETDTSNFGDVIIESDVWIGDGAKILRGVLLGRGCIIGAGCVVVKSTEPYGIYVGVPARKVGVRFNNTEIEIYEKAVYHNMDK